MGSIGNTTKGGIEILRGENHYALHSEEDCILIMKDDMRDFIKVFNSLLWEDFGKQLKLRENID